MDLDRKEKKKQLDTSRSNEIASGERLTIVISSHEVCPHPKMAKKKSESGWPMKMKVEKVNENDFGVVRIIIIII